MNTHFVKEVLVFFLFINFLEGAKNDLPSYFPKCKRFDPKLNECLLKATETVKPFLIKGVPELALPTIEPFVITEVSLEQRTRALNFSANLKDISVKGLSSYKFSEINFDVPNLVWGGKLTVGPLELQGEYNATGAVLGAPIKGNGKFVATIANADISISQKMTLNQRKNVDYLKSTTTSTTLVAKEPKLQLDGLFDGDPESNRLTNNIIRENINELFEDLKPVIEQVVSNIAQIWLSKSLEQKVPFDKLYPKE